MSQTIQTKFYSARLESDADDAAPALAPVAGLEAALTAIYELWGGRLHKRTSVAPALSLGDGEALLKTEAGRVRLIRDDAADKQARLRNTPDALGGPTRRFTGTLYIVRLWSDQPDDVAHVKRIEGDGLLGLLFETAMTVQAVCGDVPECLYLEACEAREKAIRASISRAKTQERAVASVMFPSTHSGGGDAFRIHDRSWRVRLDIDTGDAPSSAPDNNPSFERR